MNERKAMNEEIEMLKQKIGQAQQMIAEAVEALDSMSGEEVLPEEIEGPEMGDEEIGQEGDDMEARPRMRRGKGGMDALSKFHSQGATRRF